jgi:hypothetical protein
MSRNLAVGLSALVLMLIASYYLYVVDDMVRTAAAVTMASGVLLVDNLLTKIFEILRQRENAREED